MTEPERPGGPPRDDLDDDLTVEADDDVLEAIRAARAGGEAPAAEPAPPLDDLDDDHTVAADGPVVPGTTESPAPSAPPAVTPPPAAPGWTPGGGADGPADAPGDPDDVTIRAPESHPVSQPHPVLGDPPRTGSPAPASPPPPSPPPSPEPAPAAWTADGPAAPPAEPSGAWRPPERTRRGSTSTPSSDRGSPVWLVPVVVAGVVALVLIALLVGR